MIVGREPSQVFRRPARRMGQPRMVLQSVVVGEMGPVDCSSMPARWSVGLRGAGQETIGRALFGAVPTTGGRILLDGRPIAPPPRQAMANGINLVCADRAGESLAPNLTIRENLFLNPLAAGFGFCRCSVLAAREPGGRGTWPAGRLRPNDPLLPIELLSGGNQQKVVVGRWLHLAGKVYVFEDPTAGVDVGAKAEIYRLFDAALNNGAAIIIISTDFEEVAKVCHRALVFDRGRVVAELGDADLAVENLLAAASASVGHMAATSAGGGDIHAVP